MNLHHLEQLRTLTRPFVRCDGTSNNQMEIHEKHMFKKKHPHVQKAPLMVLTISYVNRKEIYIFYVSPLHYHIQIWWQQIDQQ